MSSDLFSQREGRSCVFNYSRLLNNSIYIQCLNDYHQQ
ncbi:hypothetical protein DDI_0127 [Dickeya dianthicola RNS04.9]|nr:hypothetical protein DDI_0127 [Dickeya dianthicola RNS04.9]